MRNLSTAAHDFALTHHWFATAEHALLRCLMFTAGFGLVLFGLGLGVTLVMLPVGVFMALVGVATMAAALDRDLPLPPDA